MITTQVGVGVSVSGSDGPKAQSWRDVILTRVRWTQKGAASATSWTGDACDVMLLSRGESILRRVNWIQEDVYPFDSYTATRRSSDPIRSYVLHRFYALSPILRRFLRAFADPTFSSSILLAYAYAYG